MSDWSSLAYDQDWDDATESEDIALASMNSNSSARQQKAAMLFTGCPELKQVSFVCKGDGVTYGPNPTMHLDEHGVEVFELSAVETDTFYNVHHAIYLYNRFKRLSWL